MPKFTERTALREIVKFAKREFREKKPQNVRVLRVKEEKKVAFGGPFPVLSVKATHMPFYIVALDYGDMYRLYNFGKDGLLIGGENVEKGSDKMKLIEKSTKTEYTIV
ncbi:MAG: hypothetical protein ACFFBC_13670 [Promethearchaeota archaeon]